MRKGKLQDEMEDISALGKFVEQISKFAGKNLALTIADLEFKFAGLDGKKIRENLVGNSIDDHLFRAAQTVKRAAAQIDVVLHALGVLLALPTILEGNERVQALSLGAEAQKPRDLIWKPIAE